RERLVFYDALWSLEVPGAPANIDTERFQTQRLLRQLVEGNVVDTVGKAFHVAPLVVAQDSPERAPLVDVRLTDLCIYRSRRKEVYYLNGVVLTLSMQTVFGLLVPKRTPGTIEERFCTRCALQTV